MSFTFSFPSSSLNDDFCQFLNDDEEDEDIEQTSFKIKEEQKEKENREKEKEEKKEEDLMDLNLSNISISSIDRLLFDFKEEEEEKKETTNVTPACLPPCLPPLPSFGQVLNHSFDQALNKIPSPLSKMTKEKKKRKLKQGDDDEIDEVDENGNRDVFSTFRKVFKINDIEELKQKRKKVEILEGKRRESMEKKPKDSQIQVMFVPYPNFSTIQEEEEHFEAQEKLKVKREKQKKATRNWHQDNKRKIQLSHDLYVECMKLKEENEQLKSQVKILLDEKNGVNKM